MRKALLSVLICFVPLLHAQESKPPVDPLNEAIVNLYSQLLVFPQEKIYLQTDRPYYLNGEQIFFRAFLLDASKQSPATFSRYMYVELISPLDLVVVREKIRIDEKDVFSGALKLPESLPEGEYSIRAYTRYMENQPEEFFFSRQVFVADPHARKVEVDLVLRETDSNKPELNLYFTDSEKRVQQLPSRLAVQTDSKELQVVQPNDYGAYTVNYKASKEKRPRVLLIEYHNGTTRFSKYIKIPEKAELPDLTFYPEGGSLIPGYKNRVAFQALMPETGAVEVSGIIFNDKNEEQVHFKTLHKGMGDFLLDVQEGARYHAKFDFEGKKQKVNLPDVEIGAYALQIEQGREDTQIRILENTQHTADTLYLVAHRQGVPILFHEVKNGQRKFDLETAILNTGISHVMLLDKNFLPLSERLVFNVGKDAAELKVSAGKQEYKTRSLVQLSLQRTDAATDSFPSTLAISITDDKDVKVDTSTNILAEILLRSELRGHIESPAFYFGKSDIAERAADLLMLTHGWRRYYVEEALLGDLQKPKVQPEIYLTISGTLRKPAGRENPYPYGIVQLVSMEDDFKEALEADEAGRFEFVNIEFEDSARFMLQARAPDRSGEILIDTDVPVYPAPGENRKSTGESESLNRTKIPQKYVEKANQKYAQEHGIREIDLDDVIITSSRKRNRERIDNNLNLGSPHRSVSMAEIKEEPPATYEDLFYRLPDVSDVSSSGIRFSSGLATIVVDGITRDSEFLYNILHISEVAQVDVYTSIAAKAMYMVKESPTRPTGPVLVITTRPPDYSQQKAGENNYVMGNKNIIAISPKGYQAAVEFYTPVYDTRRAIINPTPDLRSTIYWNPGIETTKNKSTQIEFYTADSPGTYTVTIEGVGPGRKLIYKQEKGAISVR